MKKKRPTRYPEMIGKSKAMRDIRERIDVAAGMKLNTLVIGENGTGRDTIVQNLYSRSSCNGNPFIKINCAALTERLFDKQMLPDLPNSAVNCRKYRAGRSGPEHCRTLFLDRVDSLSMPLQKKLYELIHPLRNKPEDDNAGVMADTWVIAASEKDIGIQFLNGFFREDFYRLISTFTINLPPLRERREDIPLIIEHYLKKISVGKNDDVEPSLNLGPQVMEKLIAYHWPGNIKELLDSLKNGCKRMEY